MLGKTVGRLAAFAPYHAEIHYFDWREMSMEEALRVLMLLRISRSRPTDKNTEGSIYSAIGRTGRNRYQKEAS